MCPGFVVGIELEVAVGEFFVPRVLLVSDAKDLVVDFQRESDDLGLEVLWEVVSEVKIAGLNRNLAHSYLLFWRLHGTSWGHPVQVTGGLVC